MDSGVVFRVASFNFGIDQKMLGGTGQHQLSKPKESTTRRNIAKFAFLCDHIVQHGDAHILFGCEVGGKEEGFRAVGVSMSDLLRQPFGDGVIVQNHFNYMSVCGFCSVDVRAKVIEETCMVHWLGVNRDVPAVITCFGIHAGGACQLAVYVVAANLRIVCGDKPPKIPVRQTIVKQLRVLLERYTAPTPGMPIVRLIVGDDNLSTDEARQALQRETDVDPL